MFVSLYLQFIHKVNTLPRLLILLGTSTILYMLAKKLM